MAELSKMQQQIYDFLVSYIRSRGYPPSVREIGEAVGLKSPSTVHFNMKHQEEAGVIEKGAGKGRAITLTAPPLPGDWVVVRRQETANNGEFVGAMIEDEATVTRLSRKNGRTWLMPENDAYSPIDGTYAQILGKVAAVIRRY